MFPQSSLNNECKVRRPHKTNYYFFFLHSHENLNFRTLPFFLPFVIVCSIFLYIKVFNENKQTRCIRDTGDDAVININIISLIIFFILTEKQMKIFGQRTWIPHARYRILITDMLQTRVLKNTTKILEFCVFKFQ